MDYERIRPFLEKIIASVCNISNYERYHEGTCLTLLATHTQTFFFTHILPQLGFNFWEFLGARECKQFTQLFRVVCNLTMHTNALNAVLRQFMLWATLKYNDMPGKLIVMALSLLCARGFQVLGVDKESLLNDLIEIAGKSGWKIRGSKISTR